MNIAQLAEAQYRTFVATEEHPAWEDLKPWQRVTLIERMVIALGLEDVQGAEHYAVTVSVNLDPEPYEDDTFGTRSDRRLSINSFFNPRDGYSQNIEDYQ